MISLTHELYMFPITFSIQNTKYFENFLQTFIKEKVDQRLNILRLDNQKITVRQFNIPLVIYEKDKIFEKGLNQVFPDEDLDKTTQMVDSEEDSFIEEEFDLKNLIERLYPHFTIKKIKIMGTMTQYFGVQKEELFEDTLFKVDYILRLIDFGNQEFQALNLFYPVFEYLKKNISTLYSMSLEMLRKEEEDANIRELRHRGEEFHKGQV